VTIPIAPFQLVFGLPLILSGFLLGVRGKKRGGGENRWVGVLRLVRPFQDFFLKKS
jgi:hypothetical protein